ncbi:conserved protein of unknown function [Tenacibaculum soleae]|uniref:hypothetical protein n=1 Tax=Tenacibaculum soleae TaxID=447689 RepID=UPI003AB764C5
MEGKTKVIAKKLCMYSIPAMNTGDEGYIDGYINVEGKVFALVICNNGIARIHIEHLTVI